MQTCKKCGEIKPDGGFEIRKSTGLLRTWCKTCQRAAAKVAQRGVAGNLGSNSPPPPEPTAAPPGTAEKVAVMAARAELGLALFHEIDARDLVTGYTPLPHPADLRAAKGRAG